MEAKETLKLFLAEMLTWEVDRYKKTRMPEYRENIDNFRLNETKKDRAKLGEIFDKYLTPKAIKSIGAPALDTMAVSKPPQYDQSILEEEIGKRNYQYICSSNNGGLLDHILKYELVMEDGAWKIDNLYSKFAKRPDATWKKRASI